MAGKSFSHPTDGVRSLYVSDLSERAPRRLNTGDLLRLAGLVATTREMTTQPLPDSDAGSKEGP